MERIKGFYERISSSKIKSCILKFSLIIPAVGVSIKIINLIINDLIYKTPRPIPEGVADFNILYYILYEGYWKIGIAGIVFLIILDLISLKGEKFKKKENR